MKLSLFADMIIFVKNPKEYTKELLELKNKFNKCRTQGLNTNSTTALFTSIAQLETEYFKISTYNTSNKNKILRYIH